MSKLPLQIGVTGGIGSGKSIVCTIFNTLGVPTYDADSRAKWVMMHDESLKSQLIEKFGRQTFTNEGELNRTYVSSLVFNDKAKLDLLNSIVHPRVALDYKSWVTKNKEHHYLIKEAALLYESGSYKQLDKIIVVSAPEVIRVSRVLSRDSQRTRVEVNRILEKQMPEQDKILKADYVLKNDESTLLILQVLNLHEKFTALSCH